MTVTIESLHERWKHDTGYDGSVLTYSRIYTRPDHIGPPLFTWYEGARGLVFVNLQGYTVAPSESVVYLAAKLPRWRRWLIAKLARYQNTPARVGEIGEN